MSLFDIFGSIIGFFLNLILKPLTPAIDYIFERLVIVATSPLATKRFTNLLFSILDRATSEDHREDTFKRIDKLICLIPTYLNRCESRPCLQKLGPSLIGLPVVMFADKSTTLDKGCELVDTVTEYIDATVGYVTGTAKGTKCLIEYFCAVQGALNKFTAATSTPFMPNSDPLAFILQIVFAPNTFVPGAVFENVYNNPELKTQLCAMFNDPCQKDLKMSTICMLKLAYEAAFVANNNYGVPTPYTSSDPNQRAANKAAYMALFGDGNDAYTAFTRALCNIDTTQPNIALQPVVVTKFIAFMKNNYPVLATAASLLV